MKVLFLAYYFPPDSSSGSLRPLFFANHLSRMGADIHVLTARVENYLAEQPVDKKLLSSLDDKVQVTRCFVRRPREALLALRDRIVGRGITAGPEKSVPGGKKVAECRQPRFQQIKDMITDLLATPDPQVGWINNCVRKGKEIIAKEQPDLIFATGGPWSGLVAAARLKKASGLPLVLDFRDPWFSNPTMGNKAGICKSINRWLEKYVVKSADAIVANTEGLRQDFLCRFKDLSSDKVVAITNGFEEYLPVIESSQMPPLTLTHTGALYFSRNPLHLLQAAADQITSGNICKDDLRLQFVGGIEVDDPRIRCLLASEALKEVVKIIPRVPYAEAIRFTQEADALLILQPGFPLQIPRKLFEYMAARKPLFCITERQSATEQLVIGNELGYVCENEVKEIGENLQALVKDWRQGRISDLASVRCDKFKNNSLTKKLWEVLCQVGPEGTSLAVSAEEA